MKINKKKNTDYALLHIIAISIVCVLIINHSKDSDLSLEYFMKFFMHLYLLWFVVIRGGK